MKPQADPIQKLAILFVVLMLLSACGDNGGQKSVATSNTGKAKTPVAAPAKAVPKATPVVAPVPPQAKYVYITEGRRDPFQPLVLVKRPVEVQTDQTPLTPLQQYEVVQLKLNAIIVGFGEPAAMLNAPDGKSYVVRKGMKIGKNGGRIVRITTDTVHVEEKYRDLNDEIRNNVLEIKLPKREGV